MFGFISKKKILNEMDALKESGRKENNGVKYPPETEEQEKTNILMQGYEDGHDNFYNGLKSRLKL